MLIAPNKLPVNAAPIVVLMALDAPVNMQEPWKSFCVETEL